MVSVVVGSSMLGSVSMRKAPAVVVTAGAEVRVTVWSAGLAAGEGRELVGRDVGGTLGPDHCPATDDVRRRLVVPVLNLIPRGFQSQKPSIQGQRLCPGASSCTVP